MIDLNNSGDTLRQIAKISSPIDTGNLRDNGIGGLSTEGKVAEFSVNEFDNAPYGIMLNDASVIRRANGEGYNNRHYLWFDNAIKSGVYLLEMSLRK